MYAVVTEVCQGVCKILAIVSTVGAVPTYGTMALQWSDARKVAVLVRGKTLRSPTKDYSEKDD